MKETVIPCEFFTFILSLVLMMYFAVMFAHSIDDNLCPIKTTRFTKFTGLKYVSKLGCYLGEEINE